MKSVGRRLILTLFCTVIIPKGFSQPPSCTTQLHQLTANRIAPRFARYLGEALPPAKLNLPHSSLSLPSRKPLAPELPKGSTENTRSFLRLLEHIVEHKNGIEIPDLKTLWESSQPIAPTLSPEMLRTEAFVFDEALKGLLKSGDVKWDEVQEVTRLIAERKAYNQLRGEVAEKVAEPIFHPVVLNPNLLGKPEEWVLLYGAWQSQKGNIYFDFRSEKERRIQGAHDPLLFRYGDESFLKHPPSFLETKEGIWLKVNGSETEVWDFAKTKKRDKGVKEPSATDPQLYVDSQGNPKILFFIDETIGSAVSHDGRKVVGFRRDAKGFVEIFDALSGNILLQTQRPITSSLGVGMNSSGGFLLAFQDRETLNVVDQARNKVFTHSIPRSFTGKATSHPFLETSSGKTYFGFVQSKTVSVINLENGGITRVTLPEVMEQSHFYLRELGDGRIVAIGEGYDRNNKNRFVFVDFSTESAELFSLPNHSALVVLPANEKGEVLGIAKNQMGHKRAAISLIQLFGSVGE